MGAYSLSSYMFKNACLLFLYLNSSLAEYKILGPCLPSQLPPSAGTEVAVEHFEDGLTLPHNRHDLICLSTKRTFLAVKSSDLPKAYLNIDRPIACLWIWIIRLQFF